MLLPALENLIAGEPCVPPVARQVWLKNPNDCERLQAQAESSPDQLEQALAAAQACHERGDWENAPELRVQVLEAAASELERPAQQARISQADALTTGAVLAVTRRMAGLVPHVFRAAAAHVRSGALQRSLPGRAGPVEVLRRPWGPAALIAPWNGPTAIGSHKLASAVAAGAPALLKPSEWAPHSAIVMAQALQAAGAPAGAVQLLCGGPQLGAQLVADPRVRAVSFTGGLAGGRAVARACAEAFKPTQLELGGNNPLLVFEDADLEQAAQGIAFTLTMLNAQWCRALGRLIVHTSIKERLLEAVLARLARVALGHSLDEASQMGPLVHEGQYRAVRSAIARLEALGGRALTATPLPALPGYFVAPTLIDGVDPAHTREEVFGPVACVHTFRTEAEAVALANDTPFGLAAYVYADELRAFRIARALRTGGVKINGTSLLSLHPDAPRAAWGDSGLGEEGTAESIQFLCGARVLGVSAQDRI